MFGSQFVSDTLCTWELIGFSRWWKNLHSDCSSRPRFRTRETGGNTEGKVNTVEDFENVNSTSEEGSFVLNSAEARAACGRTMDD